MKHIFLTIVFFNLEFDLYSQIKWEKSFGGDSTEYSSSIIETLDGNILIGSSSNSKISGDKISISYGQLDYWVIKLDLNRKILWQKSFGGTENDILTSIINTNDSGFMLLGWSYSTISGNKTVTALDRYDYWLIKIDKNGNIQWQKTIGGNSVEYSTTDVSNTKIINTKDGNYILSGTSRSGISGNKTDTCRGMEDYWIVKLDNNGNILWDKTYGGDSPDFSNDIVETTDSGFLITGMSQSGTSKDKTMSQRGFWLLKLDKNGSLVWQKSYGGNDSGLDQYSFVTELDNQDIILSGWSSSGNTGNKTSANKGGSDYWVIKLDKFGNEIWQKSYGGEGNDMIHSLIRKGNNLIIVGVSGSDKSDDKTENSLQSYDIWTVELNALGNIVWQKTIGGYGEEMNIYTCKISNDKFYVLCSSGSNKSYYKSENSNGFEDLWLLVINTPRHLIKGKVFADLNSNCVFDPSNEQNTKIYIVNNQNEKFNTIINDSFYVTALYNSDTAILKIINLDSNLYVACGKDSIVVDMTGKTDTSGIDFPIRSNKTGHCINITSFSSGLLRPGMWGDYQLNYQNNAFDTAYNAYIEIEVDTAAIDSIKSPYSFTLTGTILRFNLGHVRPFGFSSVSYSIKLKTNVIIGSSHCHRAKVFPICNLYPSAVYDSSEIQPMMRCLPNDTVEFTLKNIGLRDQKDWGHSIIYVDELILKKDSFKLTVGNSRIFKYKLNTNKVFTAEVFNSNYHPVTPILIRHNDLCANKRPMIPQNAALNFSRHDEAKEYEEACTIVRGSYDPNIKSVQPVGMFAEHYTATGTELKYRIDFQNTGTDTAFRVVLIDTLSSFLDIASFVPGVSSHPYSVEFGGRAVKFIFDPIRLIDSGTNEPASHGYVHFKIKHITGISPKTKIENKADIYFDYNAPIRTNAVFNTIFDTIQIYVPKGENAITENHKTTILVFPNPTTDKFFIQMSEPVKYLSLEIYDMQGRLIKSVPSSNNQTIEVSAQGMTQGIYHIRCMSGEKLVVVKKVMVE